MVNYVVKRNKNIEFMVKALQFSQNNKFYENMSSRPGDPKQHYAVKYFAQNSPSVQQISCF